jgi:transcriptional regulator with XRE-family HTH domain
MEIKEQSGKVIGKKIRDIREELDLTQIEFAERLGTDKDQISRYERGLNIPRPALLKKIAALGKVSVDYLTDLGLSQENKVGEYKGNFNADSMVMDLMSDFKIHCEENRRLLKMAASILDSEDEMVKNALASNIKAFFDRLKRKEDPKNDGKEITGKKEDDL